LASLANRGPSATAARAPAPGWHTPERKPQARAQVGEEVRPDHTRLLDVNLTEAQPSELPTPPGKRPRRRLALDELVPRDAFVLLQQKEHFLQHERIELLRDIQRLSEALLSAKVGGVLSHTEGATSAVQSDTGGCFPTKQQPAAAETVEDTTAAATVVSARPPREEPKLPPEDFSTWDACPKCLALPWMEKRRRRDIYEEGYPKVPWIGLGGFLEKTPATWRGDDIAVGEPPSGWSKWRWAFICGLSQRADLNGAIVSVSLQDIRATVGHPETRCKASRYPTDYLQSIRWGAVAGDCFPRPEYRESEVTLVRRKNLRIFALAEWWECMGHILHSEESEAEEDTKKLGELLKRKGVGVYG